MANPPKPDRKDDEQYDERDAWKRFERAVDAAVKSGPKHRASPKPHKPKPAGKRRKPAKHARG